MYAWTLQAYARTRNATISICTSRFIASWLGLSYISLRFSQFCGLETRNFHRICGDFINVIMNALIQTKMGLFKPLLSLFCAISHQMACSSSDYPVLFLHLQRRLCFDIKNCTGMTHSYCWFSLSKSHKHCKSALRLVNLGFNLCHCKNQSKWQPKI